MLRASAANWVIWSQARARTRLLGAIQVPPNGQPVILGPDHPVTGGYPVIGVITNADADAAAQIMPGQTVRLRWTRPRIAAAGAADW